MQSSSGVAAIVSVFSNRNYAVYASTNILSHFGSWIQRVAMGWLAWELEKSGYWLGVVAVAELVPAVRSWKNDDPPIYRWYLRQDLP